MELPNLFELDEVLAVTRSTMISALVVAAAGLVAFGLAGYAEIGAGLVVGLAGGAASNRSFQRSMAQVAADPGNRVGRQVGSRTLQRLGVLTALAIVLLVLVRPLGAGVVAGLALFQFLLVVNIVRVLLRARRGAL